MYTSLGEQAEESLLTTRESSTVLVEGNTILKQGTNSRREKAGYYRLLMVACDTWYLISFRMLSLGMSCMPLPSNSPCEPLADLDSFLDRSVILTCLQPFDQVLSIEVGPNGILRKFLGHQPLRNFFIRTEVVDLRLQLVCHPGLGSRWMWWRRD